MNRKPITRALVAFAVLGASAAAQAQVTFYEGESFHGRAFTASGTVDNFDRVGFNDRASSVVVDNGRWEACEDANFQGRCVILRPGSYDSLGGMQLSHRVSSVRPVADGGSQVVEVPPPMPAPNYSYYRRPNEPVFEAPVTTVRAVMGPPEQRCWVERQEAAQPDRSPGRAIIGGVIGGILGHQIGGGTGKDIATAGGAVAGAAIGANRGRARGQVYEKEVQHCQDVASAGPPAYWDVSYDFRGVTHQVQMSSAPGATVLVNADGEPRQ